MTAVWVAGDGRTSVRGVRLLIQGHTCTYPDDDGRRRGGRRKPQKPPKCCIQCVLLYTCSTLHTTMSMHCHRILSRPIYCLPVRRLSLELLLLLPVAPDDDSNKVVAVFVAAVAGWLRSLSLSMLCCLLGAPVMIMTIGHGETVSKQLLPTTKIAPPPSPG